MNPTHLDAGGGTRDVPELLFLLLPSLEGVPPAQDVAQPKGCHPPLVHQGQARCAPGTSADHGLMELLGLAEPPGAPSLRLPQHCQGTTDPCARVPDPHSGLWNPSRDGHCIPFPKIQPKPPSAHRASVSPAGQGCLDPALLHLSSTWGCRGMFQFPFNTLKPPSPELAAAPGDSQHKGRRKLRAGGTKRWLRLKLHLGLHKPAGIPHCHLGDFCGSSWGSLELVGITEMGRGCR